MPRSTALIQSMLLRVGALAAPRASLRCSRYRPAPQTAANGTLNQKTNRHPPAEAAAAASVAPYSGPNTLPASCNPATDPSPTVLLLSQQTSPAIPTAPPPPPPPPNPRHTR